MKKILALLLSVTMMVLVLQGCGTADDAPVDAGEPASAEASDGEAAADETLADEPVEPEPEPEPLYPWAFDAPENQGVDGAVLESMHAALEGSEVKSVVVVRGGVIVDEYYKDGFDESSIFRLHSCSKSFTGAMMGLAIAQGRVGGVDDAMADYLRGVPADKQGITVGQLLAAVSGIEWYEWGGSSTSFYELVSSDNWVEHVLSRPMAAAPGSTWTYTTGGSHLLAAIVQEATGQSMLDYAEEYVFGPLGMDSVEWSADPQGVIDGGNGIAMTARDAAKFGQLFLNGGSWDGTQIIPREWVEQSTSRQSAGSGRSGVYGYQWWIQQFGAGGYDTYYAMGHGGQFIFVVPELELVTVITSDYPQDTYAPWPYFTDYILAACS